MPQRTIELLNQAAEANYADSYRQNNLVLLPDIGKLIICGDIHGHRRNFERVVAYADLENNPETHLVLQEIIHGGPIDEQGGCISYRLLFDICRLKLKYPDRVHIIMSNHDTAFITNSEVLKDGREMNVLMNAAIEREFVIHSAEIKKAIRDFLISEPLAVKCQNRLWVSHSLPADRNAENFDKEIFHRPLSESDLTRPGSAYLLTWGRKHSQRVLDRLAELLDVDVFVLGHQPQDSGCGLAGENLLIITSEHNHGCILQVDLSQSFTAAQLFDLTIPLASIS